ncbi:MAG TPA: BadF/BadG/BcrA/BcrD ATPase family protein [Planctomycetaceae bacterium]|nr:BadF/BadG/BcrA/BcrD ATPase family protein [Planctomycetaceae bacterium]
MTSHNSPNDDLVIGVDGGGTKTVAWVAPLDDPTNTIVLGRGEAGPGNPRAVSYEFAQMTIGFAVAQALADAGRPGEPVAAAHLGLAGAGRAVEQTRMADWARGAGGVARQVRVTGDAEPVLAAGSPDHWGIALIGGTGSLAWGRNQKGDIARTGGWGYLIGDEGSAHSIVTAGLRAAMQSYDGRGPSTSLLPALQQRLGAAEPSDLIDILYASDMTRDRIAACAEVVFDVGDDRVAAQIIAQAAGDLAAMIATLAHRLDLSPGGYPLVIAGSLLLNQESLRRAVLERLTGQRAHPRDVSLVTDPVRGAVALARRLVGGS